MSMRNEGKKDSYSLLIVCFENFAAACPWLHGCVMKPSLPLADLKKKKKKRH